MTRNEIINEFVEHLDDRLKTVRDLKSDAYNPYADSDYRECFTEGWLAACNFMMQELDGELLNDGNLPGF